jgi:hypothetical protein
MRPSKLVHVALTLAIGFVSAKAGPQPGPSIKRLVNSADLIIVGRVERLQQTGVGSIELQGHDYARVDFKVEMSVEETIKGQPPPYQFAFNYSNPGTDDLGNVADGALTADVYQIVFLKKTVAGYAFASPYFPSLPATPNSCGPNWQLVSGGDAYSRVLQRVLNLLCTTSSRDEKRAALGALNWQEDSPAAPVLKAALDLPEISSDNVLKTTMLSDLLKWNDLSVLPMAEDELFLPSQQAEGYMKSNLLLAISSLDPQISVPLLSRALKLPEPDARVGAARFLEYTKSDAALDSLLRSLDDPDREVRFAVMQSLGNITGQHAWRPHTDTSESDPFWNACVDHWREFGAQRKADLTKSR